MMKRTILILLALLMLTAPALSLAESDYEEGDGWVYQDGELKITTNNGLINFLYHEYDMRGDTEHKHTTSDVDHVVIGKDVTDIVIDDYIRDFNPSSTSIEEGNTSFIIDGGWVVNKKTYTLFGAANVRKIRTQSVIDNLPTYIEHIGMYAFVDCRALKKISIPETVTSIGESSFYVCDNLESITLPSAITSIGGFAFDHCTKLTHIILGAKVRNIDIAAFFTCINLETPAIYLTKIETAVGNSFWGCNQFRTVEFPSTLKKVEDQAFTKCKNLNTLIFNSDQLIIENGAFSYCENVRKLVFTKVKPISIGSTIFSEDGKTPDGKSFITYMYNPNGETIPYPTLYYTAAYAGEWAPNGETEWNGYPIQQISREELEALLAEARGEAAPESVTLSPAPTQVPTPTPASTSQPDTASANPAADDGWMLVAAVAAVVAVGVAIAVFLVNPKRKSK